MSVLQIAPQDISNIANYLQKLKNCQLRHRGSLFVLGPAGQGRYGCPTRQASLQADDRT